MRLLLDSPPAPDTRSERSDDTADPERAPRGWRALAVALAGLLAQSDQARVSDARRHERELASQRAAHDRDLLQDREAFLGLVAHELKTPAAVIKAYAELLDAQLADASTPPSTLREVVGNIRDQADLMSGLIEGVLDIQRLRLGKLPLQIRRIDIVELARTVASHVQQTTTEHIIRVVAPGPPPPLLADQARVRQVLANLLENAVKYSAGGEIEIRISRGQRNRRDCAIVAIRDEGTGIDAANLDRIFDPFQQGSASPVRGHVGLGLGLFVARQIARAHEGDVWAESRGKDEGSTFYLALPLDFGPES
jgi:two-component system, OmpR family, phosphate regulon sensor histidine kinase PhoR